MKKVMDKINLDRVEYHSSSDSHKPIIQTEEIGRGKYIDSCLSVPSVLSVLNWYRNKVIELKGELRSKK